MVSDKSIYVRIKGDISDFNRAMLAGSASAKAFSKELDTSTDRSTMLVQSLLAVGPALVPLSAAAVPAISGLTNQLAFAAAGAGVAALAFSGVGDALKATNDYAIEPTEANLEKMRQTLAELGPAGREFTAFLQEIRPQLQGLQDVAQEGLLPGAQAGIEDLMSRLPQFESIVSTIATSIGDLLAEAGDNLADPRWNEFFDFIETEARPTLIDMGRTLGNFAEGFANLWMAFDPLSDNFSKSFLQMSRDFASWTDGLAETDGFQEFIDYVQRVGPKAWETLGALGNALLQIVEAAAPVGEVMLPVITALADVLATIADSPAGPVLIGAAAGISAISRAVALYKVANGSALSTMLGGGAQGQKAGLGFRAAGAGLGILALSMTDFDEKAGLSNTTSLVLAGSIAGPWGAAIGAGAGLALDFAAANDDVWKSLDRLDAALAQGPKNIESQKAAYVDAKAALDDLNDSVEKGSRTDNLSPGDWFKSTKNFYEGLFGSSDVEEANAAFEESRQRLLENVRAAQDLVFQEVGLGGAMDNASDATRDATQALLERVDAHNKATEAALTSRDAERAYEEAIDTAAETIKKNGATLDITTEKGRENQAALDDIADTWNGLDANARNARGGIESAKDEFVKAAMAAGKTEAAARVLADQLLNIEPPKPIVFKTAGADEALAVTNALRNALDAINPFKNITIRTTRQDVGSDAGNNARAPGKATGGSIVGPGTGTSDSIPALLSNGEHVFTASDVAKLGGQGEVYRLRDAIQSGRLPAFATGGAVGAPPSRLEIKQAEANVRDIERALKERETVKRDGKKVKRDKLRGLDREIARLQLSEAKQELRDLRSNKAGLADIAEEAERILSDANDKRESVRSGAAGRIGVNFDMSASSVERNLARTIANSQTFLGLLGDLKAKGAAPWLLQQFVEAGPTGGAIRLARQYVTNEAAFNSIQSQAAQIDAYSNAYSGLVGSANFLNPGAWNSGITAGPQQSMTFTSSLVGAEVSVGSDGLMRFVQGQIVVSQQSDSIDTRFAS